MKNMKFLKVGIASLLIGVFAIGAFISKPQSIQSAHPERIPLSVSKSNGDVTMRIRFVSQTNSGYQVGFCYSLPNTRQSIDFSPQFIKVSVDGVAPSSVQYGLDQFIFGSESKTVSNDDILSGKDSGKWTERPTERCDVASFAGPRKAKNISFGIDKFSFPLDETVQCSDFQKAAEKHAMPFKVDCNLASGPMDDKGLSKGSVAIPSIGGIQNNLTIDEAMEKLVNTMTELRSGDWSFNINLSQTKFIDPQESSISQ